MIRIHAYIILILVFLFSLNAIDKTTDLSSFCPANNEIEDYQASGEPEFAVGEDLYLVINGGAEIYHEYGFKKAVFQTYTNPKDNAINLEIFEMENNAAAFGIFSFKTGKEGIHINLGYEGFLESYYLNFWKGNYLVTITAMQTDSALINDLKKLAMVVDKKIQSTSTLPAMISCLPEKKLQKNSIKYLKGNQALFNQDLFGPTNIFGLQEGIMGSYPDYSLLILRYMDSLETKKWFNFAKNFFMNSKEFTHIRERNGQFEIRNSNDVKFWVTHYSNMITVIFSNTSLNFDQIFESVKDKIKQ